MPDSPELPRQPSRIAVTLVGAKKRYAIEIRAFPLPEKPAEVIEMPPRAEPDEPNQ